MSSTNVPKLDSFAACIGLDWADNKHDICLQATGTVCCSAR